MVEIHPSWSYLWDEFRDDYVLYCLEKYRGTGSDHCLIFCKFDGTFLRIEDNSLSSALKQRMLDAGVPIVCERPLVEFDINAKQNEVFKAYATFEERQARWEEIRQQYEELYKQRQQNLVKLKAEKTLNNNSKLSQ